MRTNSIIRQKTLTSTLPLPSTTSDENIGSHQHAAADHCRPSCRLYSRSRHFLTELLKPIPTMIAASVVTALVDPMKALFLPPSGNFQPSFRPVAPDGQPPLAFVLDTAGFVGAVSVPIGLIYLGSALACLRLRSGETFPRGAIAELALARMVVTPLLRVGITRWFVRAGFVDRDDKVLQFVCMCVSLPSRSPRFFYALLMYGSVYSLFSGLPSATTQVSGPFALVFGMYSLASVGLPHANLLAYWLRGTLFSVLDTAVHPDAFHYDWIGCIYAQLPLLRALDGK
jgi:hypothetical protein